MTVDRGRVRRSLLGSSACAVLLAGSLAGCGVGTGTLRIADAEAQIVAIAEAIVEEAGLRTDRPVRSAPLEQCALRAGGQGVRTRVEVRGTFAGGPDALAVVFDAAAAVLVRSDLVLVESGVPGTLLGQRDGITVTVGSDGRVLEVDALTGCRPR